MSSISDPHSDLQWLPAPESIYRVSVEQYEAMVASGVFNKRDHLHLIQGILVAKMTEYPPHAAACDAVRLAIEQLLPSGWYVRPDKPLRIPSRISMPEPDAVVTRGSWRDYTRRHPEPADVALVVEVAESSLRADREMAVIYAGGGVPVYWVVNLIDRQVEVFSDPGDGGYQSRRDFAAGQHVPLVIEGCEAGRIAVAELLT
jgi:Uma2 family endonuclease